MRIGEKEFSQMPEHLQRLFVKLPNPGSDEVLAGFPETKSGKPCGIRKAESWQRASEHGTEITGFGDSGSAARFFYCAKASKSDRAGSKHPTVKPVSLMRWLVRLVTPPGGVTLDPFAGSGTTGEAAYLEGFGAILIEREAEYQADIARRMQIVLAREPKADHGPLFAHV